MSKEVFVPWESRYELGVPMLDDQHKKLLHLTNVLHENCILGLAAQPESFKQTAEAIVGYVNLHFSGEERLMTKVGYPDIEAHTEEHRDFIRRLRLEIRNFGEGRPLVVNRMAVFLRDWILTHIATVDRRMVDYLQGRADVQWGVRKEEKGVFIPWDDSYSVGIPLVDDQHRELLILANALYETCREGSTSARDGFRNAVSAIVDYVKKHFSTEEKIMERTEYPLMGEHKAEHREFVSRFLSEVKAFEGGKPFVTHAFTAFLKDWILTHVARTDKKMGIYVLRLARKGAFSGN